jgi:hypothetical protein
VLFEIANESHFTHSKDWQYHLIRCIKNYERTKTNQHPVGMTGYTRSDNSVMAENPADWISPGGTGYTHEEGRYKSDPPPADGRKVILLDTDDIWGVGGPRSWVWKSFLRGYNPIWMDPYAMPSAWEPVPHDADDVRRNLGAARRFAERIRLAAMTPRGELATSGYCLADPPREYLAYLPAGGKVTIDLSNAAGPFAVEWFHPGTGQAKTTEPVRGASPRSLDSPFVSADAVVYLKASR